MPKEPTGVEVEATNGGPPADAGAGVVTTDASQTPNPVESSSGGVVATPVTTDASKAAQPVSAVSNDTEADALPVASDTTDASQSAQPIDAVSSDTANTKNEED